MIRNVKDTLSHKTDLGFIVHKEKSILVPTTKITTQNTGDCVVCIMEQETVLSTHVNS